MRQLLYHWVFEPTSFATTASTTFAGQNWPPPKEPFSLFTSSFGSAGKIKPAGFNAQQLTSNWDRKQISHPPIVKSDQFVVINNFGSTPGVLPLPDALELNDHWDVQIGSFAGTPWRQRQVYTGFTLPTAVYDLRYEGIQNPDSPINMTNTALRLLDEGYNLLVTTQTSNKSASNPEGYVFLLGAIDGLAGDIPKLMEAWLSPIGINNIVVNDAPVSPDPVSSSAR